MKYILNERDVKLYNVKDFCNKVNSEPKNSQNIPNMSTFQIYDPNHDYSDTEEEQDDVKIWTPAFSYKN